MSDNGVYSISEALTGDVLVGIISTVVLEVEPVRAWPHTDIFVDLHQ